MLFCVAQSCFEDAARTFGLITIAGLVVEGRHRLYVEEDERSEYICWVKSLPIDQAEMWRVALDLSMQLEANEPARVSVAVSEDGSTRISGFEFLLDIQEAAAFAKVPFALFVENNDADRDFFYTFSDKEQARKLKELESRQLFRFEHCGGIGELPKKVRVHAGKREGLCKISAALFDSDAVQPGEESRQAELATQTCKDESVVAFMLKRRAIENYLQIDWLNSWLNTKQKGRKAELLQIYQNFCKLSADQRYHFHMKDGLRADANGITNGSIRLYEGVEANILGALQNGFGDSVGSELFGAEWVQQMDRTADKEAWVEVNGMVSEVLTLCR